MTLPTRHPLAVADQAPRRGVVGRCDRRHLLYFADCLVYILSTGKVCGFLDRSRSPGCQQPLLAY